ncbi:SitI3 family protein [Micromonospora sp. WMMD812]|uniref:SitI3 family protein n=1 Tax=Micromonospora sp. WMMD812 TaxID=3015152 RepID=UPI00248C784A|nr:SitI3 family protein [Micromonospora sp. WMMD812]WBB70726.1 SitI3 family protein [Micromonospora sp. WMMD812]
MALEFRLTLAGDIALEDIAELAAADPSEKPTPTALPRVLSARLYEQRGYALSVYTGDHGYFDAEDDDGSLWEWELTDYVNVGFSMRGDEIAEKGIPNMAATVARVLAGRPEDAALVQTDGYLLLTRVGGVLRKHRPVFWSHYGLEGVP